MDFWEKMHGGALYQCMDEALLAQQLRYLDLLYDFNQTRPTEQDKRTAMLREMFAEVGEGCYIEPPFHANWGGKHIHLGKFVYCNTSRNGSLKNDVLAMYPAFFGYNNTVLMTMVTEEGKGSPSTCDHACKFIQAYRSAVELPASASPWYLPSAKELQQVADNLSQLNSSLTKAGGQELVSTTAQSGHYWTSVLRSEVYQWTHGMEGGLYTVLAERGSRAGQFRMMAAF